MPKQISCVVQDYFEAACIYQYQLDIELIDGTKICGKAINLKSISKIEYLVLANDETEQQIDLAEIKKVEVITPNAKFKSIKVLRL